MMPIPIPESLWLSVAVDLCGTFSTGETLLILVDYSSRFPFAGILKSTTHTNIISKLFKIFSEHGLPETLGDNFLFFLGSVGISYQLLQVLLMVQDMIQ